MAAVKSERELCKLTNIVCKSVLQPLRRPFIITKNDMQKAVFGLGYPGIPTVTVDEFYNQRVHDGTFPSPHCDG